MYPERYVDPKSWIMSRGGTHARAESPEEALTAIGDMLAHRRPGATLCDTFGPNGVVSHKSIEPYSGTRK